MKIAYHFACGNIIASYDRHFYGIVFKRLLQLKHHFVSSKILVGDLLLWNFLKKIPDTKILLYDLISEDNWKRINPESIERLIKENIFIICFETVQKEFAEKLHLSLADEPNYIGAFEIDNSSEVQWHLYGECIGAKFRISNRILYVQIDSNEIENREYADNFVQYFRPFLFDDVKIEYVNYRYSIFDDHHNYENAKRTKKWAKNIESVFSTIPDEIISKLTDAAPQLNDKLWAMTTAFESAETTEQYAHVMLSCRRVFGYVTDCLFPATNEKSDGHSLAKDKYKNRLYAFASKELKSNTNVDLMVANAAALLFDEWENLYELANKGTHAEPNRQECRRCIVRTILLLDDLIAIKNELFEVNVTADKFIAKIKKKYEE